MHLLQMMSVYSQLAARATGWLHRGADAAKGWSSEQARVQGGRGSGGKSSTLTSIQQDISASQGWKGIISTKQRLEGQIVKNVESNEELLICLFSTPCEPVGTENE